MNQAQLLQELVNKTDKSLKESKAFLDAFKSTLKETLAKGDKIVLTGFGTWDVQDVPARMARNPRTGESLKVAAKKKIRFKAGSELAGNVSK